MQRAIRRRAPLAALALAAPLMLSSSSTESAVGEPADQAGVCEVSPRGVVDPHMIREMARLRSANAAPAAADLVVLNGRGFNYGAAEPAPLDRIQLEALMADVESQRR
jgi:hypothetical protein